MEPLILQFQGFVTDLTTVERRNIVALTEIAGDVLKTQPHLASSIAQIISNRILQAPSELKLPALYLLDSITKNVGEPYKTYFAASLPEIFYNAWTKGGPALHKSLDKLLNTWVNVFPSQVLDVVRSKKSGTMPLPSHQPVAHPIPMKPDPRLASPGYKKARSYPPQQLAYPGVAPMVRVQQQQHYGGVDARPTATTTTTTTAAAAAVTQQKQQPMVLPDLLSLIASATAQQQPKASIPAQRLPGGVPPSALHKQHQRVSVLDNPPSLEFRNEKIKETNLSAIERLHVTTEQTKSAFLDRKFLRRQQLNSMNASHRLWYVDLETWLAGSTGAKRSEENKESEVLLGQQSQPGARALVNGTVVFDPNQPRPSVPANDEQTHCALSGERFEQFWDEEHQEWRYKDALKLTQEEAVNYGLEEGALVLVSALGGGGGVKEEDRMVAVKREMNDSHGDEGEPDLKRVKTE